MKKLERMMIAFPILGFCAIIACIITSEWLLLAFSVVISCILIVLDADYGEKIEAEERQERARKAQKLSVQQGNERVAREYRAAVIAAKIQKEMAWRKEN